MDNHGDVLRLIERIARIKVRENFYRWPPICIGILHQPKRPDSSKKTK